MFILYQIKIEKQHLPEKQQTKMPEIDWDVLEPAIMNRKCVLFLGPDAYSF